MFSSFFSFLHPSFLPSLALSFSFTYTHASPLTTPLLRPLLSLFSVIFPPSLLLVPCLSFALYPYQPHLTPSLHTGTPCRPLPNPPLHRLRPRKESGSVPSVEAQPLHHAHVGRHVRRSWCGPRAGHLYGRRQLASVHGALEAIGE